MGKAILLTNCDFSAHNIGQVTFTQDIPLISLGISGPASASGSTNVTTYSPVYNPVNTNQRGVTWTITSGSQYATITTGGTLSILEGASGSAVTIKVTSTVDSSIYATKNITVTYDSSIETNTITVTATPTTLTATASEAVTSNVTITLTGDLSTTLTINSGTTGNSKSITSSGSSRTCNLAVSPSSDASYNYVLNSSTVIIPAGVGTNIITVSATENSITATSSAAVTSAVTVTFTGDLSTTLTIASGSTTATGSVETSASSRTCSLAVSPTGDASYNYVLSSNSIVIPAHASSVNIMIVGPASVEGDVRAGNYFVLDTGNMKQVVGSAGEVTDDYKEYLGTINWSITSGTGYADLESASGTAGNLNVKSGANNNNVTLKAVIGSYNATKTVSTKYRITDYIISSFADLEALEDAVNNGTESSFTIPLASGSTYTPTTGFSGAKFRFANDIDCGGDHVEIGKYNTSFSVNKTFQGIIDGAGYALNNVGGACGVTGSAGDGGYVGSALIGAGKNCKLMNFSINGSVTWAGTRGYAAVQAFFDGTCYIDRVYQNLTSTTDNIGSGNSILFGWNIGATATFQMEDIVFAGEQLGGAGSIIGGGQNANGASGAVVNRMAALGKYKVQNIGTASAHNLSLLASVGARGTATNSYSLAYAETYTSGSGFYASGANATNDFYEDCVLSGTFGDKKISEGQGTGTNIYTTNGCSGGTNVSAADLKTGSLFNDSDNWIEVSGYYPILNNQFAVDPLVLARAKYGYQEAA